jgi:hypothetical protein
VGLDEMLDDGQPQSGAPLFPRAGMIDPVKPLEDPIEMLVRDP